MPTIPRSLVDSLTRSLNILSDATKQAVRVQLERLTYTTISDLREQVIAILQPLLSTATDMAASYAAANYDSIREYSVGESMNAEAHSGRIPEATEGAVRALVGRVETKGYESFMRAILDRCDYEIKKSAADCTIYNAGRDKLHPRYARVPTGRETCEFCIMLASRGFVYHTEGTAGAVNHYHANCDCRVIPGFEGDEVEGYDPDEYYRQWKESGFNPNKSGKSRNQSKFQYESNSDSVPSFKNFDDVKRYLYGAKTQDDLEHRSTVVGNIYGYPQSLRNVMKTAGKRIGKADTNIRNQASSFDNKEPLALGHIYLNHNSELYRRFQRVQPIDGYDDVGIHSDGLSFEYSDASDEKGKVTKVSVPEFAKMIKSNPHYKGGAIRLLACSAGKYPDGAAQMLSNTLGVDVLAADKDVFVDFDGTITLADSLKDAKLIKRRLLEETGNWIIFHPKAS